MTLFDYGVLIIIGLSVLVSVIRGLVREVMALAGWVVAFVTANVLSDRVSEWMPAAIENPSLRLLAAFLAVFIVTLVAVSLVSLVIRRMIANAGLGVEDRVLGAVFGLTRGLAIVMVFVLLAGLTTLPAQPVWNNAMLAAPLEALAVVAKPLLPDYLSQRITYD